MNLQEIAKQRTDHIEAPGEGSIRAYWFKEGARYVIDEIRNITSLSPEEYTDGECLDLIFNKLKELEG